jgi:hypothetical protein
VLGSHPKVGAAQAGGGVLRLPADRGLYGQLGAGAADTGGRKGRDGGGYTFGRGNDGHLRLCFAISTARMEEALGRVVEGTRQAGLMRPRPALPFPSGASADMVVFWFPWVCAALAFVLPNWSSVCVVAPAADASGSSRRSSSRSCGSALERLGQLLAEVGPVVLRRGRLLEVAQRLRRSAGQLVLEPGVEGPWPPSSSPLSRPRQDRGSGSRHRGGQCSPGPSACSPCSRGFLPLAVASP